ncbi:hypothetical protein FA10DRAFT_270250 [Acaromyces ingoldii]|uniref:Uncharacterized protein n=1 Tax=Acaromyces ingoldii TaxID=215250 RepID=A0A316YEF5_9BASI|nr:hypothetical protein FA10DRAFT_270250 [Acaromyces ingoldii]PWN86423.1 hypothetical protein FA10DRAFT_270250 [Acaromyces ingoldii]
MTSHALGFYVGIVYIQMGIELLILESEPLLLDNATGWLTVHVTILFTVSVYFVSTIGNATHLPFRTRYFISSFAFADGCVLEPASAIFPKTVCPRCRLSGCTSQSCSSPQWTDAGSLHFWIIEVKRVFGGVPLCFPIMVSSTLTTTSASSRPKRGKCPCQGPLASIRIFSPRYHDARQWLSGTTCTQRVCAAVLMDHRGVVRLQANLSKLREGTKTATTTTTVTARWDTCSRTRAEARTEANRTPSTH